MFEEFHFNAIISIAEVLFHKHNKMNINFLNEEKIRLKNCWKLRTDMQNCTIFTKYVHPVGNNITNTQTNELTLFTYKENCTDLCIMYRY